MISVKTIRGRLVFLASDNETGEIIGAGFSRDVVQAMLNNYLEYKKQVMEFDIRDAVNDAFSYDDIPF